MHRFLRFPRKFTSQNTVLFAVALALSAGHLSAASPFAGFYSGNFSGPQDSGQFMVLVKQSGSAILLAYDTFDEVHDRQLNFAVNQDGAFAFATEASRAWVAGSLDIGTAQYNSTFGGGSAAAARQPFTGNLMSKSGYYKGTYVTPGVGSGTIWALVAPNGTCLVCYHDAVGGGGVSGTLNAAGHLAVAGSSSVFLSVDSSAFDSSSPVPKLVGSGSSYYGSFTFSLARSEAGPSEPPSMVPTHTSTRMVSLVGGTLDMGFGVSGPEAFTLQWKVNNSPVANATGANLLAGPATLAMAGGYRLEVTCASGVYPSPQILVGVVDPAPMEVLAVKGKSATLTMKSAGTLPQVAWTRNNSQGSVILQNSATVSGATTTSLTIKNVGVGDHGDYFWDLGSGLSAEHPIRLRVISEKPDYGVQGLPLPDGIIGGFYEHFLPQPPNEAGSAKTFAAASLPPGLKIDAKTGRIYGRPTALSKDPLGYPVKLTIGNEWGKTVVDTRLKVLPLPDGVNGIFNGPIPRGSELGGNLGGRLDMTVSATGAYTAKFTVGAETLSASGSLEIDVTAMTAPFAVCTIKPKGTPQGIKLKFSFDGGAESFSGGIEGSGNSSFTAWRNIWPKGVICPWQGNYTFGMNLEAIHAGDPELPQGTSFGSFTVAVDGKLTVSGKLADGESFTTAGHASRTGEILIWKLLGTGTNRGSLQGTAALQAGAAQDGSDNTVSGDHSVTWRKPQNTTWVYRTGFGPISLSIFGGRYLPPTPAATAIVMGLAPPSGTPAVNAALEFDRLAGADAVEVDADIQFGIKPGGGVLLPPPTGNPKKVTLSVTPKTGAFRGGYTTSDNDPRSTKPVPSKVLRTVKFEGLIIRGADGSLSGHGFFLRAALPTLDPATTPTTSTISSGAVILKGL